MLTSLIFHCVPNSDGTIRKLKMHHFSGGAFEHLISSQLQKKEKYI